MKKIMIIICVFVFILIGCDQSSSQMTNGSDTIEEQVTLLKIKQRDTIASVYSEADLVDEITILSAEEVLSVKEVYKANEKIISYKVELKYGNIGYVRAEDFYIIDTLTEDYIGYLTPKIDISRIKLSEDVSSESFIDSYMTYDLYVDGLKVEDVFNFIKGMRYEIYAIAYDRYDMTYISATEILDTEVSHVYCKVREEKDVDSKELTRFLNYSDYKYRVESCEISYKNGKIEAWYAIKLDDGTIGYSNDKLYHVYGIKKLFVSTGTETIELENSDFKIFNSMPSVVQIDSQRNDELHLIDFASDSHISYLGEATFYDDNILVVDHYDATDDSNRQLSLLMYVDGQLNEVATTSNYFSSFENVDIDYYSNINFEAHFNQDVYWPLTQSNDYIQYGSFKLGSNGYHLIYKNDFDFEEPLLDNVVLYRNPFDTTDKIGTFNSEDIFSTDNEKKLDIINKQIVCWFNIVTVDGREGFAFRPLFDYELDLINLAGYYLKLADGSEYSSRALVITYNNENSKLTNDLAPLGMYTSMSNTGYTEVKNTVDRNDYDLDNIKMVTEYAALANQEIIVSKYNDIYYRPVSESELSIYQLSYNDYKVYYNVTFNNATTDSFIWLDENTISFFIVDASYESETRDYPSVLRRVDNRWNIESDYTDYKINRNDKK